MSNRLYCLPLLSVFIHTITCYATFYKYHVLADFAKLIDIRNDRDFLMMACEFRVDPRYWSVCFDALYHSLS